MVFIRRAFVGRTPDVYFAKSTDNGATWSTNVRVSALPYDNWPDDPSISVQPDGTIWVSWYLFYTADSNKVNDVRLARSTDGYCKDRRWQSHMQRRLWDSYVEHRGRRPDWLGGGSAPPVQGLSNKVSLPMVRR